MAQDNRKQVLFRCDPGLYAAFAEAMRKQSKLATVNVGAELVEYMQRVVHGSAGSPQKNTESVIGIESTRAPSYDLEVARQKSMEAAKALNEAISALSKATGGSDEFDSFTINAAGKTDDQLRQAREDAQELARDGGSGAPGKHARPRKTSGGKS